jgi:hypothetical protein
MQQLSETRAGRFELLGFAGNSAPDHVDHLHAMPEAPRAGDRPVSAGRVGIAGALATALVAAACAPWAPARETGAGKEIGAALIFVEGLDEEGGTIGRGLVSDSALVAFFRDHLVLAQARLLAEYLAPNTRVDIIDGTLRLGGKDTGIPVERRDSVSFVPVQPLADQFRAYARIEESPGRMVTLWRHDILCRYAHGADRRADVFLAAAEQGLLRHCDPPIHAEVRRWANTPPNERWAASVTLRQPLDSANAAALLEQYDAAPYAAYGVVAGHHLVSRVPPDSASLHVLSRLGAAGIDALQRALCGLPSALERRGRGTVRRRGSPGSDPFRGERHMLAGVVVARRELPRVRAGAPIVFGVDVIANARDLRRLAADTRIHRFEPATKVDETWVVPGADLSAAAGVPVPSDIAALDSATLFARLDGEAARLATECPSERRR